MSSTAPDYVISCQIVAKDATGPGAKEAEKNVKRVVETANSAGLSIGRLFALIGGAAGIGYAVRGMIGLNSQIQDATIGMASLLNASTGTPMDRSIRIARTQLQGLREDAAKGAGELTDYTAGFQVLLNPGLTAGKSLAQIRELTRTAIGAGFALRGVEGIQYAPRDVQQALTGQLGERTTPIVFQALRAARIDVEKFRRESTAAKFDDLTKAFGKFGPGIEAMGKTWSAQFATLEDNVKETIRAVTGPLFDRWTKDLVKVNDWLKVNKGHLAEIAESWGKRLVAMWDVLIKRAGTYASLVAASAVIPYAGQARASVGAAMAEGGILAKLGGAAVSGAKGGVMAAGIAGSGSIGMAWGALTGGVAGALKAVGAAMGPIAIVAGAVVVAFLAIKGAIGEFHGVTGYFMRAVGRLMESFGNLGGAFESLTGQGSILNLVGAALVGTLGGLVDALTLVVNAVASVVTVIGGLLRFLGAGAEMTYLFLTGDLKGATKKQREFEGAFPEMGASLSKIWGMGEKGPYLSKNGVRRRGGDLDKLDTPSNVTNINGPITMHVKTEVNADPARVMVALNEGVDRLRVFATQGKRLPVVGV